MSTVCIVPGCPADSNSPSHTFPKNVERALQWLNVVKTERLCDVDPQHFHKYRVCYRHFSDKLIRTTGSRRRLVDNAIPDQNLPGLSQARTTATSVVNVERTRCKSPLAHLQSNNNTADVPNADERTYVSQVQNISSPALEHVVKRKYSLNQTCRLLSKQNKVLRLRNAILKYKLNDCKNELRMLKRKISNGNCKKNEALADSENLFSTNVQSQVMYVD